MQTPIHLDDHDTDHWIRTGLDLQRRGEHSEATRAFENACLADADNPVTLGRLWNSVCKSREVARFLDYCTTHFTQLQHANVDFYLAVAHERQKDLRSAEVSAQSQVKRHPDDFKSLSLLARLQMRLGHFAVAL